MHIFAKSCSLVLALNLLGGSGFAAVTSQDSRESVTVTGRQDDPADVLKADLDPLKEHFNGLTGDKIARDIDPLDRYMAFAAFARGLTGPLLESYDWYGLRDNGDFRPTREFRDAGLLCRDFTEKTDHHAVETLRPQTGATLGPSNIDTRAPVVMGTACREGDGWHFR